eukprot:22933_1
MMCERECIHIVRCCSLRVTFVEWSFKKGGFYVRNLNGSSSSFDPIFEDLAPSFVILSQRLNVKLLDNLLFTLDRNDVIGGSRVADTVITMYQITTQIKHIIRHNTMSWTDTCLQHIIDEYMSLLDELPSPSQQNHNHNHNTSASQSQSRSPSILYGLIQSQSQSPNNHDSSNCNRTSPSVLFPSFATVSFPFAAFNSNHNQPSNTNAISCNSAGSIRPAVHVRRSKRTLSEVDYRESRISYPNPKRRRTNASQQPSSHDASGVDDE